MLWRLAFESHNVVLHMTNMGMTWVVDMERSHVLLQVLLGRTEMAPVEWRDCCRSFEGQRVYADLLRSALGSHSTINTIILFSCPPFREG